jgi:hypothetical protein
MLTNPYAICLSPFSSSYADACMANFANTHRIASSDNIKNNLIRSYESLIEVHFSFVLHSLFKQQSKPFSLWAKQFYEPPNWEISWNRVFSDYPILKNRFHSIDSSLRAAFNEFSSRLSIDKPIII